MNNNLFYFSRFTLATALFFCFFSVQGQPEIYPADGSTPWTPENLVSQILIGDGLDGVTNVTYTGDLESLGYFKETQDDLSIDRGVIMSSGNVVNAPGVACTGGPCTNTGNNGTASTNTTGGTDADLFIAGNTGGTNLGTFDAAILEFDFVPNADTLEFRYVFASEEYQNYTCATFSDVFGFFLSGPGITGGLGYTDDAENVALIPGTNIPVSINSVNSGAATGGPAANCTSLDYDEFFINNINLGLDIEYNGLTTVLTATAVVIPCETYHIKLAISDMGDGNLDSAVFLEAGSFGTNTINVEPYTVSLEGFLAEGCENASISFTIPEPAENDIPINYTIEGTAQNGVDYTFIPLGLFIPQGEDSIGFIIDAFEDGVIEGEETFLLIVEKDICFYDTVVWTIVENPLIEPVMADAVICDGGTTNLNANIPVFQPPPTTFINTDSEIIAPNTVYEFPIQVSNSPNEILGPGMISSICMNIINSAFIYEVQVYLSTPSGAILELSTQNGAGFILNGGYINTCFTETASTDINFNSSGDNYAPGTAVPFTGNWQPEAPWSDIYGSTINGTWTLLVTDVAAGFAPTFQDWSITFNSSYFLTYEWDNAATLSCDDCAAPDASPSTNTTYTVTVTDSYGCTVTGDVNVDVVSQLPAPVLNCGASTATSVMVEWADVGASSYEVNIDGAGWIPVNSGDLFYEATGLAIGQTVTIEVIGLSDDCDDTPISTIDCTAQPCILAPSLDGTTDLSCFQANDGTATLSAIGNGTITYDIGGGNINNTGIFSNLAAGDYTVSITDDDCTLTETFTIIEPLELTASPTFSDVTCNGAVDGSIIISTLGGSPNYTYQWSSGITDIDETVDGLSGGDYTVTITDDNGCTITAEQTINENTIVVLTTANTQATCNGIPDGTATVTATGGTGTYDYLWDAAAANQITATAVADVGTYVVTVTDTDGCSMTASVDVTAPPAMMTTTSATQASCSGSADGTATVVANGGAGGYTYEWEDGQITDVAINFADGWHYVTVMDSNGCNAIDSAEVTVPNPINLVIDGNNVSCFGGNDGDANVVASGGSGGFTYAWNPSGEVTDAITTITATTYTVIVTDSNGCTASASIDITEPDALTLTTTSTMVACFGESTGTVTTTVGGGTGTYIYLWDNAAVTDMLIDVPVGTYIVTVTDDNGCTIEASQIVNENTIIALTTANTQATCDGIADGTATVTATGGTGTYDYLWDTAAADQITDVATGLDVGTYVVTVTDSDACSMTASVDVTAPPAMTTTTSATQASCSGSADGTATVVANGGVGGYSYEWEDGQITDVAIGFADGWHYVTVTDTNGCNAIDSAEVTVPNPINLVIDGNNVSCFGGNDGDANVVASGGAGGFTYAWNPSGEITDAIATITATTYTVIVTDANGCTASASIDITEPDALTLTTASTMVACFGESTGTVTTTVGGGTGTYNYLWDNSATTDMLSNVPVGTYIVTVTDDNGCTIEASQIVDENPLLELTTITTNANCNDSVDGTATVTATGGTGTYDYLWNNLNADATDTATDLDAGTYIITVTDSDGCISTASVDIIAPLAIATSTTSTPTSCSDATDGTATVVATDGSGGFIYEWDNTQNTATATGLPGGWHYVTVTDMNGCTALDSAEVIVPSAVILSISGNNVSCAGGNDGDATVSASGGAGGYTYLWAPDGEITETITGLAAGTYTVITTDMNGCSASTSIDITEPDALTLIMSSTIVSCFGQSTGTATATVGGGTGAYSYNWSNAGSTETITGLAVGTYTVTATDINLCEIIDQVIVTEQPELTSAVAVGGASCNGGGDGSAIVTPNGGTPPYTYLWNDNQITQNAVGLMAQTYTVTVTDDLGCTTSNFIDVAEPPALSVAVTGTNISCFAGADGTVSAVGNGGDGNYTFTWNAGGGSDLIGLTADIYTVTISDGNGCTAENTITLQQPTELIAIDVITNVSCNGEATGSIIITPSGGTGVYSFLWSDGSTGQNCENVTTGTYILIFTDGNGCTFTESYVITEPTALSITLNPSDVFCFMGSDGGVDAIITGGTTPYSYAWTDGFIDQDLSNIPAGNYTLVVTDNNGCIATATTIVNQPAAGVSVSMSADETVCFGATTGIATVTATGGAIGYTYQWSNGSTSTTANNLGGGTYTVTVMDANGCTTSGEMNVNELAEITGIMNATATSCFNGTDGTATVLNISGGIGMLISDYTVVWSTTPVQNGLTATGLTANQEYTATISDAFGCVGTSSVVVPNPTEVGVSLIGFTSVTCSGGDDGSLTVDGSGGTAPYSYLWDNAQTSETAVNLGLGTYFVTVTDANGCTTNDSYEVTNPSMLDVSISNQDASCPGLSDGMAIAYPTGGTQPYTYEWSNGETTATLDSLDTGNYNVTITDANGCMVAASTAITQPVWLTYTATKTDVTCNGDRDGSIIIEATGGTSPYEYSYDWGETFEDSNVNVAMYPGYYGVVVRDANGCLSSYESIVIEEPLLVEVNIDPDTTVISYELEDSLQLSAIVDNGIGAITYEWSGLYGNQGVSCLDCADPWFLGYENNTFEVVVTDENGCSDTDEIEVLVSREREIFVPSGFTPNGDGINDALMVHGNSSTKIQTFRVYDRWGELVFRADNYAINSTEINLIWDGTFKGKTMNSGVYIWHLAVKYIDGREENFEGNTTLLR
jgi:gliding motility-associated-like protein